MIPCHSLLPCQPMRSCSSPECVPYRAHTFGSMPVASRIKIGTLGLFFFIVGYARFRNDLSVKNGLLSIVPEAP